MRTPKLLARAALGAAVLVAAAGTARAGEGYGLAVDGDAYGYGFAGPLVRGSYVGAPFTRLPRPTQIVPAPWSYGTYGVPTVSGRPPAPTGRPTVTVINARGSRAAPGGPAQIIEVQVPRR